MINLTSYIIYVHTNSKHTSYHLIISCYRTLYTTTPETTATIKYISSEKFAIGIQYLPVYNLRTGQDRKGMEGANMQPGHEKSFTMPSRSH